MQSLSYIHWVPAGISQGLKRPQGGIRFHLGPRIKISGTILSFPIRFHELRRDNSDFNTCAMLKNVSVSYVLMSYEAYNSTSDACITDYIK